MKKKIKQENLKEESTLEEWQEEYDIDDITEIREILEESISLEFVPAVLTGETREEATERLRNIFFNINTNAKKIDTNEQTIMDEQNGFSIIARNVANSHKLFKPSPSSKEKVKYKGNSLTDSDQNIVTPSNKRRGLEIFEHLLMRKQSINGIQNLKHSPKKPNKEDLKKVENKFNELLDLIYELPVYQSIERGDSPKDLRLSPSEKFDEETNKIEDTSFS